MIQTFKAGGKIKKAKSFRKSFRPGFEYQALEARQLLATYYVSASGDNTNAGSLNSPFETIQKAADTVQPGDTVLIRGGTYRETAVLSQSGTAGNPITFAAYGNEEVILSGADLVPGWSQVTGKPNQWQATATWDAEGNYDANTLFVDGELKHEARFLGDNDPLDLND